MSGKKKRVQLTKVELLEKIKQIQEKKYCQSQTILRMLEKPWPLGIPLEANT